jgi:hypothetical protein
MWTQLHCDQREAALAQARAQTESQRGPSGPGRGKPEGPTTTRWTKTISRAPFDGLVTNVPVREGETVVVGNSERRGLDPDDAGGHVGDYGRGEGGRDRHCQLWRWARPRM